MSVFLIQNITAQQRTGTYRFAQILARPYYCMTKDNGCIHIGLAIALAHRMCVCMYVNVYKRK